jgi:acyl carrier protein
MTMDVGILDHDTDVSTIAAPLEEIVLEILRMEPGQIQLTGQSNLFELGLESLNVVELLTRVEIQFDIIIDVEDLSADLFQCYGKLQAFVARKVAEGS